MVDFVKILAWATRRIVVLMKTLVFIFIILMFMLVSRRYFSKSSEISKGKYQINAATEKSKVDLTILSPEKETLHKLIYDSVQFRTKWKTDPEDREKVHEFNRENLIKTTSSTFIANEKKNMPCYAVHIFYYPWYGNPKIDSKYLHWNHKYLPHWSPEIAKMYNSGVHKPPDDIGSDFYPELGPYSSKDKEVIEEHMIQLSMSSVGVIFVSYYPPGTADDNGEDWQSVFPMLLDAAERYQIKVGFHIEPYKNRNEITVKDDLKYIIQTYSSYPAFYKQTLNEKTLPLIYIYDSYHTKPEKWAEILKSGPNSIRGTTNDAIVIGLCVNKNDLNDLYRGGFDGFYTYFAANGFTYGSSRSNWRELNIFAENHKMIFIPSVGPGYIDTRIRPWNKENTRKRANGKYYSESWNTALELNTKFISVTSFNEWHEGTQIEKAVPHRFNDYEYENYLPHKPNYYLIMTRNYVENFKSCK